MIGLNACIGIKHHKYQYLDDYNVIFLSIILIASRYSPDAKMVLFHIIRVGVYEGER